MGWFGLRELNIPWVGIAWCWGWSWACFSGCVMYCRCVGCCRVNRRFKHAVIALCEELRSMKGFTGGLDYGVLSMLEA